MKIFALPTETKSPHPIYLNLPILDLSRYLSLSHTFSQFRCFTLNMGAREGERKAVWLSDFLSPGSLGSGVFPALHQESGWNASLQPVPQKGEEMPRLAALIWTRCLIRALLV